MPETLHPDYSREFFTLQLDFARKLTQLKGRPLAEGLLEYTNLFIRLGLGRDFNPLHPNWQAFLAGFTNADDGLDWTWQAYQARLALPSGPPLEARFGCFGYGLSGSDGIRLHFQHVAAETTSLGRSLISQRQRELAALIADVRQRHPERSQVAGVSWLYNLDAYRRLFPAEYRESVRQVPPRFHSMTLWGQFVNRRGQLQAALAADFRARLASLENSEQAGACFPFQVLAAVAPLRAFQDMFL